MMIENIRLFIEEHATKSWYDSSIFEKTLIVAMAIIFALLASIVDIAY